MLDGRVWDQTPVMPEQYGNEKVIRNRKQSNIDLIGKES